MVRLWIMLSAMCMQSLVIIGYEMKKALADHIPDNNNLKKNNNNVGSACGPGSGFKNASVSGAVYFYE